VRKLIFLFAIVFCTDTHAQDKIEVNPDRPDQTNSTYTIEKGYLQLEDGFFLEKEKANNSSVNTYGLQDAAWRLGLGKKIEFDLLYQWTQVSDIALKTQDTGISTTAGFKYNLGRQKGGLPSLAVSGTICPPFLTSKVFRSDHTQYSATLLFQNDFNKAELGYNAGFTMERNVPVQWIYTISFDKEFSDKFSGYIEHYSSFQKKDSEISFDSGLAYSASDLLELDLAGGITVNHHSHFFTLGLAYLIPKKLF